MKIDYQYIVKDRQNRIQILMHTESGQYYITSNGVFGQRDKYIEPITTDKAISILGYDPYKSQ